MNIHAILIPVTLTLCAIAISILMFLLKLDLATAFTVFAIFFFITVLIVVYIWQFGKIQKKFYPAIVAAFYLGGHPAYEYWGKLGMPQPTYLLNSNHSYDIPWFANNWVQALIAVSILIIGHFITRKIDQ